MGQPLVRLVDAALAEFGRWLSRATSYSAQHAATLALRTRVEAAFSAVFSAIASVDVGVLQSSLTLLDDGGAPLSTTAIHARLASALHERGALVLRLHEGLGPADLDALLAAMLMPPSEVFDSGGLKAVLLRRGAAHIAVEELALTVTAKQLEGERRNAKLRSALRGMLEGLRSGRGNAAASLEASEELLAQPETTARLLEAESESFGAEPLAALALGAEALANRDGEPRARDVAAVLIRVDSAALARMTDGIALLRGRGRVAVTELFASMPAEAASRVLFPAFLRDHRDLEAFLTGLTAIVPQPERRVEFARLLTLRLADLIDRGSALRAATRLAAPCGATDPFRAEKRASARVARDLVRDRLGDLDDAAAPSSRSYVTDDPSDLMPLYAPPTLAAIDGAAAAECVVLGSRFVLFEAQSRALPAIAERFARDARHHAVLGLLRGLGRVRDERWRAHVAAATEGIARGHAAASALAAIDALGFDDGGLPDEVRDALTTVARAHPDLAVERLVASDSKAVRRVLLAALRRVGPALLPALRSKLRDPRWFVVRNVVQLLGTSGVAAVDLRPLVRHATPQVRHEVLRALRGLTADPDAMDVLVDALADPEAELRRDATLAFAEVRPSALALGRLEALVNDDAASSDVRLAATRALGRTRHDAAAQVLVRLLEPRTIADRMANGELRTAVAVALLQSRAPSASKLFEAARTSGSWHARKACEHARSTAGGDHG